MKLKFTALLTAVLFLAAAGIGASKRGSYIDLNREENPLRTFEIGVLNRSVAETVEKQVDEKLEQNSTAVLRVEPVGGLNFLFGSAKQRVKILEVYRGDDLEAGDEIDFTSYGFVIFSDFANPAINLNFVNAMKEGYEYLLFLGKRLDRLRADDVVYDTPEGVFIATFFCYSDIGSKPIPVKDPTGTLSAPYQEAEDYEFFALSENGLEIMNNIKAKLLEKYPR